MNEKHNVSVYSCGYCNKKYFIKNACLKHEDKRCRDNPKFYTPCFDCPNLEKASILVDILLDDNHGEPIEKDKNVFRCRELKKCVTPRTSIYRLETVGVENEWMPKECGIYSKIRNDDQHFLGDILNK